MDARTLKILNRMWRGRSYRCHGERISVLRERSAQQADRRDNTSTERE